MVTNPGVGIWDSRTPRRLVEELRIGERDGPHPATFGDVIDFDVDDAGRLYVLDRFAQQVRVFATDGSFVRAIGREGHGPGELIAATGIAFDPAGRLWVLNQGNLRYSVYDTSGALLSEYPRHMGVRVAQWLGTFDSHGTLYDVVFYLEQGTRQTAFARYDTLIGAFHDTVPGVGFPRAPFSWGARLATERGWWLGVASAYRLFETTFTGDTTKILERPYELQDLSQHERDSVQELKRRTQIREGRGSSTPPPDARPLFTALLENEEGYLWVMLTPPPEVEETEFDIFDPVGRYLGSLAAPIRVERWPPPLLRGDQVYAVTRDEVDVPYVVRLRVVSD